MSSPEEWARVVLLARRAGKRGTRKLKAERRKKSSPACMLCDDTGMLNGCANYDGGMESVGTCDHRAPWVRA